MTGNGRIICGKASTAMIRTGGPSCGELLMDDLRRYGDDVAQICSATGESITYSEIYTKGLQLAIALRELGIKERDVLSICSENRFEFTICIVAIILIGGTCAPVNVMYTKDELLHILNITKPKLIFCSSVRKLIDTLECIPSIEHIIAFDGENAGRPSVLPYSDLFKKSVNIESFEPPVIDIETHPLALLSSSGTTGMPKGVILTHANMILLISQLRDDYYEDLTSRITSLSPVPWYHSYGFNMNLANLRLKIKSILVTKFDGKAFLGAIEKYKVTYIMMVPPIMIFFAKDPLVDQYDLSTLREIWCGGAPLSQELQLAVTKRIGVSKIKQAYGMTETTWAVCHPAKYEVKCGSVGKIASETQVKVIDVATGKLLGPHKEGEICCKGPLMMYGYLGDAASTEHIFDSEGWLHTGDIGYYDDDEHFYIVDRLKELIKFKGFQVPPAEVEALILKNENVSDVAVIGVKDEVAGERAMAFVVKRPNSDVTAEQIVDFVAERVSYPKRLHGGVRFIEQIPKNLSGKILRRKLREMVQ